MIGRIVWTAALIGIGALTAALQLDRQAFVDASLAPLVPAPLRTYAQVPLAASAIAESDGATALAEAETLVRRRPLPSEHLSLLALAQAKAGDAEGATFSISVAASRGWRDPIAQEAMLNLAFEQGDMAEAGRRYAALFRNTEVPDGKLIALGPKVLGEAGGPAQQAFAEVVAGAPLWHEQFLRRGAQVLPPEAFASITDRAAQGGARFRCDQLGYALTNLRARDAAAAARLEGIAAGCL
jgi:hypothetical protein